METLRTTVNGNHCRVLVVRNESNEADWLRARALNGIGASESPTICGVLKYGSIVELYGRKIGLVAPVDETEAMRWGKRLEPIILDAYREETGRGVLTTQVLVQSIHHPFLIATPDGEQWCEAHDGKVGLVEIKCSSRDDDWKEGVPLHVWAQLQHQMAVSGHPWGTAVALLSGRKLVWADIERDDAYIRDTLIPRCEQFWSCVENRDPIPASWIDGSDETTAALRAIYPETSPGEIVELPGEFHEIHADLQESKTAAKALEDHIDTLANRIRLAIGNASFGKLPSGITYSYKTHKQNRYDVPEHIKAQYAREVEVRTLRLMAKSTKGVH